MLTASALPIGEADRIDGIDYNFVFMMDTQQQDILGDNFLTRAIILIEAAIRDRVRMVVHW